MTEADHLLAFGLSLMSVSLLFRQQSAAERISRPRFYISAVLTSVGLGGLTLLLWVFTDRSIGTFGLSGWWSNSTLTVLAGLLWMISLVLMVASIDRGFLQARFRNIFERYADFFPRSAKELAASWGVSVAAGVGEEIVYRGFLLWYGSMLLGWPAGLLLSSLLFGIAHGYQSRFGVLFATTAGAALGAIYLVSESLLLVMWIHASYDIASFTAGRIVLGRHRLDNSSFGPLGGCSDAISAGE